jgi:hypothetical protein
MIRHVGNVLLLLSALLATGFVVLYLFVARWWASEAGRHLMAFNTVIAVVLWLSVIRVFVPGSANVAWFAWLRTGVFAFVPVVLGWRLWMLVRVQVLDRRHERRGYTKPSKRGGYSGSVDASDVPPPTRRDGTR